ncbi:hypothetical protein GCM10027172_24310 [Halomonas garicola]
MMHLADNVLHLAEYHILGTKIEEHDLHYQVEASEPLACEECDVEGELARFSKRDVDYRDLSIHAKRITLWVVRRRYICRACGKTFCPALVPIQSWSLDLQSGLYQPARARLVTAKA